MDKKIISDPVLNAIQNKHQAILATGSNLFDYQVEMDNPNDIFYRPLYVAEKLFAQGYFVIRYSRSAGFSVYRYNNLQNKNDLDTILKRAGIVEFLGNNNISPTEVVALFRGFMKIAAQKHSKPFAIIIDYIPHLSVHQGASIEERIVSESINEISSQPAVEKAGNILVVYSHEDNTSLSSLLKGLYKVEYQYPSLEEYKHFIDILLNRENEFAKAECDAETLSKLSKGLSLAQIAAIFKEAKAKGTVVTRQIIMEEKDRLIQQISEDTLHVLPTNLTFDDMAGLDVTKRILMGFAEKLKKQDMSSPRAILLAGPPGTGKSTIVSAFASSCGFNLVELSDEIKSKWVGESESRLNLALNLIVALSPVILFIDEIDQSLSNRSNTTLDGGVSSHYLKTLFKFIARDEMRGKICVCACSNTPQLLDPAMINRFITIPMLEATPMEIARIFPKIEKRIIGNQRLNPESSYLLEGATLLHSKGASPRQIFDVINHSIIRFGIDYNEEDILESCKAFRTSSDTNSGAYSSLSAISMTAFEDYFPWFQDKDYNYPWYLEGIIDKDTGKVNELELTKKLTEFASKARY